MSAHDYGKFSVLEEIMANGDNVDFSDIRELLDAYAERGQQVEALRDETERLKKAARHAYFAMPMCFDCWSNEKPKRFVAGKHLRFHLIGDGPPRVWPATNAPRVFAYCDKHKRTSCDSDFVEFTEPYQVEAIVELEALGMPEVTG